MAKNHAIFNGTHCCYWDNDALNFVGVAATDMDNGIFVALGDIGLKTDGGYEFTVTATNAPDFVVATPPDGYTFEQAALSDPREFYNVAGKPMSVKKLLKDDFIEIDATAFTAAPGADATYGHVQATGKITANTAAQDAHFAIVGTHTIDCGGDIVKTWILRKIV